MSARTIIESSSKYLGFVFPDWVIDYEGDDPDDPDETFWTGVIKMVTLDLAREEEFDWTLSDRGYDSLAETSLSGYNRIANFFGVKEITGNTPHGFTGDDVYAIAEDGKVIALPDAPKEEQDVLRPIIDKYKRGVARDGAKN